MTKIFFLVLFFLVGTCSLKADEDLGGDQDFMKQLSSVKNPFEDGLPKPVIVIPKPIVAPMVPVPKPIPLPKPVPVPVTLPALNLQGVLVGEEMHEAIIDDQIVPLRGSIKGAQVVAVSKEGVSFYYKGRLFFLRID